MAIRHHVREIYFFVAGSSFLTSLAPCNRKRGVHGDDGRRATITRFMTYANRRRAELPRTIDLAKIDDRIWYVAFSWRIPHIFWWPEMLGPNDSVACENRPRPPPIPFECGAWCDRYAVSVQSLHLEPFLCRPHH